VLHAATKAEIEAAFAGFAQLRAGVLVIGADTFFNAKSRLLAELFAAQWYPQFTSTTSSPSRRHDELWWQH
jgi:hypothetical protein